VHNAVDDFSWGPLLHEDFRQRINLLLQQEVLAPGWPYENNGTQAESLSRQCRCQRPPRWSY